MGGDIHGMGKVATRAAAEGGGCNRNALPLPPLQIGKFCISLLNGN